MPDHAAQTRAEESPQDASPLFRHSSGSDGLARLERAWAMPPRWGFFTEPNNTWIGLLYVATAFAFFLGAGVLAVLIRIQLATPHSTFLDEPTYNQLFTMHGTVMMFLFAVPIGEVFAMTLLPSMIGTRDMPFPWLSAFGFWCSAIGGVLRPAAFVDDVRCNRPPAFRVRALASDAYRSRYASRQRNTWSL
jgi:cytochrome c oxidase subunit I+III